MNEIKDYRPQDGKFYGEAVGYLADVYIAGERTKTVFVCNGKDCSDIEDIINECGYTTGSVVGRRIVIRIEDEGVTNSWFGNSKKEEGAMTKNEIKELVEKLISAAYTAGKNSGYQDSLILKTESKRALELKDQIISHMIQRKKEK